MAIFDGIRNYSPKKSTLVGAFVGGVAVTLLVGFAGFGWTTAGASEELATSRADAARAELATALCVQNFMAAPDVRARLGELQETRTFQRDNYISDAGWVTFADTDEPNSIAADDCAAILIAVDIDDIATITDVADDEAMIDQ